MILGNQGSTPFSLSVADKNSVQNFLSNVQQSSDSSRFADKFTDERAPGWQRYFHGIYNHPKTWWIGIIQVQMVTGIWGERQKARAMLRQQALARVLYQLLAEENREQSLELINRAVRFNLKYRKADIVGRIHGGIFTNFASTGGRHGRVVDPAVRISVSVTNLMLATFGAAIQSIAEHYGTAEHIINSMITGKAQELPEGYRSLSRMAPNDPKVPELTDALKSGLHGVSAVNNISPSPVPVSEFCARPENVELKGLCQ